jgi:hypothetical protein
MHRSETPGIGLRGRLALTVMWCAFLAASVATLLFFAFVDPAPVVALLRPTAAVPDRTALYSVGFLFFFMVCGLASTLTAWLLSPPSPR